MAFADELDAIAVAPRGGGLSFADELEAVQRAESPESRVQSREPAKKRRSAIEWLGMGPLPAAGADAPGLGLPSVEEALPENYLTSAGLRGFARGRQGLNTIGGVDAQDARDIATAQGMIERNPPTEEFQRFIEAEGFRESAKAFLDAPVRVGTEVIAESFGQSWPSLAGAAAGGLAGGSKGLKGGPLGSAIGAAAGAGGGSGLVEYSTSVVDSLVEAGMDPADPVSVETFFADEEKVSAARKKAAKRAVPIAVFDALSAGFAGAFLKPIRALKAAGVRPKVSSVVGRSLAEAGMQAAAGAGGEATAQLAAGEDFDGKSIFLEALAEVASAPGEVAVNLSASQRPQTTDQEGGTADVPGVENKTFEQELEAVEPEAKPLNARERRRLRRQKERETAGQQTTEAPPEAGGGTAVVPPSSAETTEGAPDAQPVEEPRPQQSAQEAEGAPTATGVPESVAGEATVPETARVVKLGSRPRVGLPAHGEPDLLNAIEEIGGIRSPKTVSDVGGEYDGFAEVFTAKEVQGPVKLLVRRDSTVTPDEMLELLRDAGYNFQSIGAMYEAVKKANADREKFRKEFGAVAQQAKLRDLVSTPPEAHPKGRGHVGKEAVPGDVLAVGDKFKVAREPMEVVDVNPETGAAIVKDGDRFPGRFEMQPGEPVTIDRGSLKKAEAPVGAGSENPFAAAESLLPRRIEGAAAQPEPGARPVSLADVRAHVVKALDIPVRAGLRVPGGVPKTVLGFFRTKPETIRLKAINDAATLAHEVGHYVHRLLWPADVDSKALRGYAPMPEHTAEELAQLGARTSRKDYSAHQVQMEGVAEWMRLWLTDRAAAVAGAPRFTAFFEQQVQQDFPDVWGALRSAQEIYGRFINQPAAVKVRAHIDRDPRRRERSFRDQARKFYDDWVDDVAPMERSLGRLVSFGLPAANAKQLMDAVRTHVGGWRGKTERDLFAGQHNLDDALIGPSLRMALRGLDTEGRAALGDYMVALRATELHQRGIKTGIDDRDAREVVAAGHAEYEWRRKAIAKWQDNNLQLLVDSGIVSAESAARMRELNRDYVPFYRVIEPVLGAGAGGGGKGFVNTPSGVRRIKGSDRLIVDPLESIVRNGYVFRELAERNKIGRDFMDLVAGVQGGGRIADQIAQKVKGTTVTDEEVRRAIRAGMLEKGASAEDVDAFMGVMEGMEMDLSTTVWRAAQTIDPSKGVFGVWRGGNQEFWQLDDPELLRALLLMDRDDARMLSKFPLARTANLVTRIKRAGATLTIDFMARNPFRDQVSAFVYSEYGFVPLLDNFRGVLSALKRDDLYWKWVGSGGRYADLVATDRGDLVRTVESVAREPGARAWLAEALDPRKILLNLQRASELMEASTRIGEFGKGLKKGASPRAAAAASKDVTLNFARGGFKGKVLNKIKAFFNASVLDLDKLYRAHRYHPLRTMLRASMILTVPSMLLWWLNKDNERIQKLPEWRKTLAWNMDFSDEAAAVGLVEPGESFVLSFPKPFLLGQLYGTSAEKALDYAYKEDRAAVWSFFRDLAGMSPVPISTNSIDSVIPDVLLPALEHAANYSFFRDAPLVPRSDEGLPAIAQGGPGTSMVAQWMGEASGVSPWVIDNYVRGYFAGLGRYATDAVDATLLATVARDASQPPEKRIYEMPGLRAFVASQWNPSADLGYFYSGLEIAEKRRRALDVLVERRSFKTESKWWRNERDRLVYYDQPIGVDPNRSRLTHLRSVRDSVGELTKAMNLTYADPMLDPETKRRRLMMLKDARDRVAGMGFQLLHPDDRMAARKRGG